LLPSGHNLSQYFYNQAALFLIAKESDKSSDAQWLNTVLKSGTLSDKTAALTMLTQVVFFPYDLWYCTHVV